MAKPNLSSLLRGVASSNYNHHMIVLPWGVVVNFPIPTHMLNVFIVLCLIMIMMI